MPLATAVQGSRYRGQSITWQDADGNAIDLTGATGITGKLRRFADATPIDIDGTLTITDESNGVFTWAYGTTDVEESGSFTVQFIVTFSGGLKDRSFLESFVVEEALDL